MERILLVEDEPINRAIMSAGLRQAGYVVDEAEDGQIAWDLLQKTGDYALIVTDRQMPHMDGLELAQRVKAHPQLRHTPVLMQTASDKPQEVVEGIMVGVYYYLTKPYKDEALLAVVKAGIRERRQHEWFAQRVERQQGALATIARGEFHIQTPEEAQNIAFLIGNLFPNPVLAVSGLYELILNAIEHGNLAIGFDEKGKLLEASRWEKEVAHRLTLPQYTKKKVAVQVARLPAQIEVTVTDEGAGFDWRPYLEIEPSRATRGNGRGIAKANALSFEQLTYAGTGNQVRVVAMTASA